MAEFPAPKEGFVVTYFIVSSNVARSRDFYANVLGGEVVRDSEPAVIQLANIWIIINEGGGPTEDKPGVTLTPLQDPNNISSFLNIRVADIEQIYKDWTSRGARFLTPPVDRQYEIRAYLRDPDGYSIEVGELKSS